MKNEPSTIILQSPVHKCCASESDLYDHDCLRILPVPGTDRAIACATNGGSVAIGHATADRISIIPASALPKSMSAPFTLDIKGKVEDLVAGRTEGGRKKGLFVFEEKGDAKLRIGVDFIKQTAERIENGTGTKVAVDIDELYTLVAAITRAGCQVGMVTLYVEAGHSTVVIGNAGVGVIINNLDHCDKTNVESTFASTASDVERAFAPASAHPAKPEREAATVDAMPLLNHAPQLALPSRPQLMLPSPETAMKAKRVASTSRKPRTKKPASSKGKGRKRSPK